MLSPFYLHLRTANQRIEDELILYEQQPPRQKCATRKKLKDLAYESLFIRCIADIDILVLDFLDARADATKGNLVTLLCDLGLKKIINRDTWYKTTEALLSQLQRLPVIQKKKWLETLRAVRLEFLKKDFSIQRMESFFSVTFSKQDARNLLSL